MDFNNKNTIMHSNFATMSTEELKNLIKTDCMASPDDQLDIDVILSIMEVIDARETTDATPGLDIDPVAAQADFNQIRLPQASTAQSSPKPNSIRKKSRRLYLLVAALIVTLSCSVTASALEVNIFQLFADWTSDTFQMVAQTVMGASAQEDDPLSELRELVGAGNSLSLVPTWCPPGFEEIGTQQYALTSKVIFSTRLVNGEEEIILTITHHTEGVDAYAYISEKEEEDAIPFEVNGITHYILLNSANISATWLSDDFVCEIYGNLTQDELECMIESIY